MLDLQVKCKNPDCGVVLELRNIQVYLCAFVFRFLKITGLNDLQLSYAAITFANVFKNI